MSATPKQSIIKNSTKAVAGKTTCDPNAPCQPCQRADLLLLVVTPSVIAKEHTGALKDAGYAWAPSFDAEFGSIKREATAPVARLMRTGYLYVYYPKRAVWDIWQVMSNGLTRKIMHQVDRELYKTRQSAYLTAGEPGLCSSGVANISAQLINIHGALTTDTAWLAFSSRLWTDSTLQRYADNPEAEVLGPDGKKQKKKLRDLRGREISPSAILEGTFPATACLPLNATSLEHNVVDFGANKAAGKLPLGYDKAFASATQALIPQRFGMAPAVEKRVRGMEKASAPPANSELYLNRSLILMVPDPEGVADAHNNIRLATITARQGWMAGGVDANGKNADPNRPWERQSLLLAGYIREWVKDKERVFHQKMVDHGVYKNHTIISGDEYRQIKQQEKQTGKPYYPAGSTYEKLATAPERYRVTWPKPGVEGLAKTTSKDKIERYNSHLDLDKIKAANDKWQKQEQGWYTLLESRDKDYVAWLTAAPLQVTLGYDFDDNIALSKAKRTTIEVRADVYDAAGRLQTLAICYGGGACTNVSLKYFVEQIQKDEADKTHFIAQAVFNEFDLLKKIDDDKGTQADFYDAVLAVKDVWEQFKTEWERVKDPATSAMTILQQVTSQATQRMQEVALLPEIAKQRNLQIALADVAKKQVVWARAAGFSNFLKTGLRQYMFGVKWSANAFAAAATETTLQSPAIDAAKRGVTGKQARKASIKTRAELKPYIAGHGKDVEATIMLVVDEKDLSKIARARGEKMLDIVTTDLFGQPRGVVSLPESMAHEIVRKQTHAHIGNLKQVGGVLNIFVLILQMRATMMSWEDIGKKGGTDQADAIASLLGGVAGTLGAVAELSAIMLSPPVLNKVGTPLAAELANKIPARFILRFAAGVLGAAGAMFDAASAWAKSMKMGNAGDKDAKNAYIITAGLQLAGGASLGGGTYFAYRAALLNRLAAQAAERATIQILGSFFSPISLARCFTGIGLLLWVGGLAISFYALYLEDDDNEIFLRRSYFGNGHPQLGKFHDFDHEMQSFAALAQGTRAELEWHDVMGPDEINVNVKVFKPEAATYVTARLEAFDNINGKKLSDLFNSFMPALKLSNEPSEASSEVYTTNLSFKAPAGVEAIKLSYFVYKDRTHTQPFARGELWIED